jgi:hypothetical protein
MLTVSVYQACRDVPRSAVTPVGFLWGRHLGRRTCGDSVGVTHTVSGLEDVARGVPRLAITTDPASATTEHAELP